MKDWLNQLLFALFDPKLLGTKEVPILDLVQNGAKHGITLTDQQFTHALEKLTTKGYIKVNPHNNDFRPNDTYSLTTDGIDIALAGGF